MARGDMTRAAVLAALTRGGPQSRVELADRLGLSPATLTRVVRRLLDEGLVAEQSSRTPTAGRPATLVEILPTAGYALGVQVSHDAVFGVLTQLDTAVVDSFRLPFDPAAADAIDRLTTVVREQLDGAARAGRPVLGVGVCVPGVVDPATGTLRLSVRLGWSGTPLADRLGAALGVPVFVDNDVSAMTAAEQLYGMGAGQADFLIAFVGVGVGLGMVLDGRPYRGAAGAAGEFGHLPWVAEPDGLPCSCGNRGCLETVLSTQSVLTRAVAAGIVPAERRVPAAQGLAVLEAGADAGDPRALGLLAEVGTTFGRAMAGAVNLLGPSAVFIVSEYLDALWPHLGPAFDEVFQRHLLPGVRGTTVERRTTRDDLVPFSAACLVLAATVAGERRGR